MTSEYSTPSSDSFGDCGYRDHLRTITVAPYTGVEPASEMDRGEVWPTCSGVSTWGTTSTIPGGLTIGNISTVTYTSSTPGGSFPLPNLHPGT
jgi:hypothetical protein